MINFEDVIEVEAWLKGLPHRAQIAFGARAALRSLPFALLWRGS